MCYHNPHHVINTNKCNFVLLYKGEEAASKINVCAIPKRQILVQLPSRATRICQHYQEREIVCI